MHHTYMLRARVSISRTLRLPNPMFNHPARTTLTYALSIYIYMFTLYKQRTASEWDFTFLMTALRSYNVDRAICQYNLYR